MYIKPSGRYLRGSIVSVTTVPTITFLKNSIDPPSRGLRSCLDCRFVLETRSILLFAIESFFSSPSYFSLRPQFCRTILHILSYATCNNYATPPKLADRDKHLPRE